MAVKENSFAGITSGTAITATSQTGGSSGDQFDTLQLATGGSIQVNTSADLTDAFDRGIICNLNNQGNSQSMLGWSHAALGVTYHRMYYRTNSSLPNAIVRLAFGYKSGTRVWELRHLTDGKIALTDYTSGATMLQTSTGLSTSTIYRLEWKVATTEAASDLQVYAGEATTGALALSRFGNNITGANTDWNESRYGMASGGTAGNFSANLAAIGWSDTALLGPAQAPASGPVFTVWNGTSEVTPTSVKVWNGSAEVAYTSTTIQ